MAAGRPRAFNKENALEAAMLVFWRNGYPGTSLADLTHAMAINKPSMYAAFGNKEQLFNAALAQYISQYNYPISENLFAANQSIAQRLTAYLKSVSRLYSQPDLPAGCMMVNSMCESSGDNLPQSTHKLILDINKKTKQRLIDLFTEEQAEGNLKSDRSPQTFAHYLMSIVSGMAVISRDGATAEQLDEMIDYVVTTICQI
ncbi:MAG: TetR/AcrR family transcriptional regulator [Chloroflexi bacterium]|nr:TetR/AcrR family transcriptional regulator [Chloroflexota bacterium]